MKEFYRKGLIILGKRKNNAVFEALRQDGFTLDDFNKAHNPAGLDIGAETPEEIAVSTAAELINVGC